MPEAIPTDSEALASGLDAAIGERVRISMWRARITQKQLADALNVDQAAVSRRLRGRTPWKVTDISAAAALLGISVDDLLPPREAATA